MIHSQPDPSPDPLPEPLVQHHSAVAPEPAAAASVSPPLGSPARQTSRRRIALIAGAAAALVLVATGATVAFALQHHAAQDQAYEDALTERQEAFRLDAQVCAIDSKSYERLDGGEAIQFSRVTKFDGVSYDALWCFLERQGAPESLDVKIGQTRSLDGTREEPWGDLLATWTYHPDAGSTC